MRVLDPSAVSTLLAAADAAGAALPDAYRSLTDARGPDEHVPYHLQGVASDSRPDGDQT